MRTPVVQAGFEKSDLGQSKARCRCALRRLRPNEPHTLCMNVLHFRYRRGIYRYALQIRFAALSRTVPKDMDLNTGLHRVALTNLVCAGKNY